MADFAFFDILNPLLSYLDQLLGDGLDLAPFYRILISAGFGSLTSMLLFRKLSNQTELEEIKEEIKSVQKALRHAEPGELKKHGIQNLQLTGRQLWLSFWPALIASIPVLFLLTFNSNQFSVESAKPESRVYVTPELMEGSPQDFIWVGVNAQWDARKKAWTFYSLEPGQNISLFHNGKRQLLLPNIVATNVIHTKQWWNYLFANPAGYLEEGAKIERFKFNVPEQIIINWGPKWMRGWLFTFMLFLVLFSILIKVTLKIH